MEAIIEHEKIIHILASIICIGGFLIPKVRNIAFGIFKLTFKIILKLLEFIWIFVCAIFKWLKNIITINKMTERIEELEYNIKIIRECSDEFFRPQVRNYYVAAMASINKADFEKHFINLKSFYENLGKISKMNDYDYESLNFSYKFLETYKMHSSHIDKIELFVNNWIIEAMSNFIKHCRKTEAIKHLILAEQILKELRDILNGTNNKLNKNIAPGTIIIKGQQDGKEVELYATT